MADIHQGNKLLAFLQVLETEGDNIFLAVMVLELGEDDRLPCHHIAKHCLKP